MPTRITDRSATLIDHIYYCNPAERNSNSSITSGNLWCDITDHLPNFILLKKNTERRFEPNNLPFVRLYSPKNIKKFNELISNVSWDSLYQCSNADKAYDLFHKKITDCHDKCLPKVRLSGKRAKDKLWVTQGIKRSSNYKNKLFKNGYAAIVLMNDDKQKYKDYEKIFKKVTLAAQTAYYKEKLDLRINTVKQLWTNLNRISSLSRSKTI